METCIYCGEKVETKNVTYNHHVIYGPRFRAPEYVPTKYYKVCTHCGEPVTNKDTIIRDLIDDVKYYKKESDRKGEWIAGLLLAGFIIINLIVYF